MSAYDFRSAALAQSRIGFTSAQVPSGDQLHAINLTLRNQFAALRLIRYDPQDRAKLGQTSTPDEVHINQLYAQLVQRFPQIMDSINRPRDLMDNALTMESNLSQLRGSLHQFALGARAAAIVCFGDQTDMVDRIESTIMTFILPTPQNATPADERSRLLTQFYPQQEARDAFFARQQGRQQRQKLRAQQQQAQLAAATSNQDAILQEEALRTMTLPPSSQPAAPAKKSTRKKKTPKTPPATP